MLFVHLRETAQEYLFHSLRENSLSQGKILDKKVQWKYEPIKIFVYNID